MIDHLSPVSGWRPIIGTAILCLFSSLDLVVVRGEEGGKQGRRDDGANHDDVLGPFLGPIVAAVRDNGTVSHHDRPPADFPSRQFVSATADEKNVFPVPPSELIAAVEWAPKSEIIRLGRGSDNWPLTWADDGHLYTGYGDGWGFEPRVEKKLSLGLGRIEGDPPGIKGVNVRSEMEEAGDGRRGRKSCGMLMVDGTLYMFLRNADRQGRQSQLAWSQDRGKTWSEADWRFETFGYPTFLNFGQNYADARDEFVYLVSHDHASAYDPADRFILMRVPKTRVAERVAYEFFVRRDADNQPVWTKDIDERGAVFEHEGRCYRSGISYNAGLGRYVWCQIVPSENLAFAGGKGDVRFEGGFGVYDAPEPWGPWTTAYFTENWDVGPGETSSFPPKWISDDGKTMWLVFSGDDYFSVRRADLTIRQFPQESWQEREPRDVGLDPGKLEEFATALGGDGVVVRDGYLVKAWGRPERRGDWASAAKPVLSTLLMFAVQEGKLSSVDDPVRPWVQKRWPGKDLSEKDRGMTFRQLTNMTSGYARAESPGTHWAYNDLAISLYRYLLIEVLEEPLNEAALKRFAALQFQDGDLFGSRGGEGVNTSPRDFARIGWLWLNQGNWDGKQLLPSEYFDRYLQTDVPSDLPRTKQEGTEYLEVGSYGGGSDQDFVGQGVYGFNWWLNAKMPDSEERFLPHLPEDAYCAIGHRGKEVVLVVPSLRLVVAARGDWGGVRLDNTKLLRDAVSAFADQGDPR